VSTSVVCHRGLRNGAIQTGAVALMLGAAFAMNSARAAGNDADHDDAVAVPAPPAPSAAPAVPAPPAAPRAAERSRERRDRGPRTDAERAEIDARLRDAQERLSRASAEIAAIAAERAADAMESLPFMDEHSSRRTTIGVQLSPDSKDGAKVVDVSPGGAAEEAGLRAGDVIVNVNGTDVKADSKSGDASREVVRLLRAVKPDTKVKVRVLRDGKPKDFEVVARPYVFAFQGAPNVFVPDVDGLPQFPQLKPGDFNFQFFGGNRDLAGLEVTTLTPQLGRYFGATKGVLVVRAPKSDVYKLQDGDVIVSIDGREPTSGSHITRILSSYQPGEQLTLRVMRDRKQLDLQVTVPERSRPARVPTAWVDFDEAL